MFRNWLFPKKRGVHRTGSVVGGRAGEAIFFLCLFLIGVGGAMGLGWSYLNRGWPVANFFPAVYYLAADGVVEDSQIQVEKDDEVQHHQALVMVRFPIADTEQAAWVKVGAPETERREASEHIAELGHGSKVVCYYDPADPTATTLSRPTPWGLWLTSTLLVVLAIAGAYGVITSALAVGTSAERRAALAKAASSRIEDAEHLLPPARDFPNVPRDTNLVNSPGAKLKYRLPPTQEPAWRLFGSAIWMLTCAALAVALTVVTAEQLFLGQSAWLLGIFALVVIGLAAWATYSCLNELITASWMGPTSVEVGKMPLFPGDECEVFLSQSGNLQVSRFSVLLICDEETTFLQGTDIRHDRQCVFRKEIFRREQFAVDASTPIEEHFRLRIPNPAMHSHKSPHNGIVWKLITQITADDWPAHERTFPIVVYPAGPRESPREDQP